MPVMNLLVAFNGSDASVAALRYAASLAKQRGAHVTEGPAFNKLNLPVFGVTGDHRIDHVETGHAIGEFIFASL